MKRTEAIEQLQNCIDLIKQDGQDYLDERDIPLLNMTIKVLQGDMYCPNCGVRLVQEDEYLEPTPTHGRLIDADMLKKKAQECATEAWKMNLTARIETVINQFIDWIDDAPTVQADRPHGEWISNHDGSWNCSECGLRVFIYAKGNYCPNCGCDMRGDDN